MAAIQGTKRIIKILQLLTQKPRTYSEIYDDITTQFQDDYKQGKPVNLSFSIRTFQRDIKAIENIFNISIHNRRDGDEYQYYIHKDESIGADDKMLELLTITEAIQGSEKKFSKYIASETRPNSLDRYNDLIPSLHLAIKNKQKITFQYDRGYSQKPKTHIVFPLFLKEYRNRWYLLAEKGNHILTFALDRFLCDPHSTKVSLKIENAPKSTNTKFDPEEYFRNVFGIIKPSEDAKTEIFNTQLDRINDISKDPVLKKGSLNFSEQNPEYIPLKVEKVVLEFTEEQFNYAKALPLHSTQKEQVGNEFRFEMHLYPTYEFIMEILSFGEKVEVIEPIWLRNHIASRLTAAILKYTKK